MKIAELEYNSELFGGWTKLPLDVVTYGVPNSRLMTAAMRRSFDIPRNWKKMWISLHTKPSPDAIKLQFKWQWQTQCVFRITEAGWWFDCYYLNSILGKYDNKNLFVKVHYEV